MCLYATIRKLPINNIIRGAGSSRNLIILFLVRIQNDDCKPVRQATLESELKR